MLQVIHNLNLRTYLAKSFRTKGNQVAIIKLREAFFSFQEFMKFSMNSEHKILLCPLQLFFRFKRFFFFISTIQKNFLLCAKSLTVHKNILKIK
jgi:hypothetical protein